MSIDDKLLFKLSLILSLIGSWFSVGFYHPDEQYYAIDFAAYKIGQLTEISSWEHQSQIRPWLLPTLFIPFLSLVKSLGLSPFFGAWILRVVSTLLAWWALCQWNRQLKSYFHQNFYYLFFVFATHFSFFCFFMGLRTSSENWSTSIFLLALVALLKKKLLWSGFLLGLAFSFRHQLGIMALGLGLWSLLIKKESPSRWFTIFAPSILLGVGVGLSADIWGYDEWTLTPWNYIYQNLVLDKAASFGVSPFYAYFVWILKHLHIWGVLLIIGLGAALANFRGWVCWTVLPFLLIHMVIGHKELRFLYPITPMLLFSSVLFLQKMSWKKYLPIKTLVILNGFFLLFALFKPAYTPIGFYRYLYFSDLKQVYVFQEPDDSIPRLEMKFYQKPGFNVQVYSEKESVPLKGHFFTTKYHDLARFEKQDCRLLYSSYPSWISHLNFFNWLSRSNMWALTRCEQLQ